MDEVEALVATVLDLPAPFERQSYAESFGRYLGLDPHSASMPMLRDCARSSGLQGSFDNLDRDGWLDLLMSHRVQPALGLERPAFVHDYPDSQAALARVRPGKPPLAERFELFVKGVELANGYSELTDAAEQRRRFERDQRARRDAGLPEIEMDERLLGALAYGLPPCAGVALGVDRLVMLAAGADSIKEIMAFDLERA